MLSMRRHQTLVENIVSVIIQFSRYNLNQMLTRDLRAVNQHYREYVHIIIQMLTPLVDSKLSKDQVTKK